jgi:hypothetical protein
VHLSSATSLLGWTECRGGPTERVMCSADVMTYCMQCERLKSRLGKRSGSGCSAGMHRR